MLSRVRRPDVVISVAAFLALCIATLVRHTAYLEPDDLANRLAVVALSHGHVTLSTAQFESLGRQLRAIAQWVRLPNGRWVSEKNPGYPFFTVVFQLIGALRVAPLFYGALGCIGLYFGGRRWLGPLGGAWAVVLYCISGAGLVFAWRATMATYIDASLIAAGAGALLWTLLATDATPRRRLWIGLLGFLGLEGATFIRYTDAIVLVVAIAAVAFAGRRCAIRREALEAWGLSVVATGVLILGFDAAVYGNAFKTGYKSGEVNFGLSSIWPNIKSMPGHLAWSMPVIVLALAAVVWIAARLRRGLPGARRDGAIAAALFAGWFAVYGIYSAYAWTVPVCGLSGTTLSVIRFYLPALGLVALLAAWLITRLPRWLPIVAVAVVVVLAGVAYPRMADAGAVAPHGGPQGPAGQQQICGPPGGQFPPPPPGGSTTPAPPPP